MNSAASQPTLLFLRAWPENLPDIPPLASSLQSFESALLSIQRWRFPDALVQVVTAWESCIKAALRIPESQQTTLEDLISAILADKPALRNFSGQKIACCRQTRNRIIHYGFTPRDDEECARRILQTAIPFYEQLLTVCFGYWLTWQSAMPGASSISELPPEKSKKVCLFPQIGDHLQLAREYFRKVAINFPSIHAGNGFIPLAHAIVRDFSSRESTAEARTLQMMEECGGLFQVQADFASNLDAQFGYGRCQWFDCPVCDGLTTFAAKYTDEALEKNEFRFETGHCVNCDLHIQKSAIQLIELMLVDQLDDHPRADDQAACFNRIHGQRP
jgi:hypothetical protein